MPRIFDSFRIQTCRTSDLTRPHNSGYHKKTPLDRWAEKKSEGWLTLIGTLPYSGVANRAVLTTLECGTSNESRKKINTFIREPGFEGIPFFPYPRNRLAMFAESSFCGTFRMRGFLQSQCLSQPECLSIRFSYPKKFSLDLCGVGLA